MPGQVVIQGYFPGGQPRLSHAVPGVAQAFAARRSPPPPPTRFGPGQRAAQPSIARHPPGPPAPAFAAPVSVAQRHKSGSAWPVDPTRLGLAGGGRPLPDAVRSRMEAALGADFSAVRVHVGPQAERIGAIAFTAGNDICFAPGRYQPDSPQGQRLLGHELAHVVQQRQGRVRNPLGAALAVVQDHALEAEADRMGQRAAAYRHAPHHHRPDMGMRFRTNALQRMQADPPGDRIVEAGEQPIKVEKGQGEGRVGIRLSGLIMCVGVMIKVVNDNFEEVALIGGHFVTPTMYDGEKKDFNHAGLKFIDSVCGLCKGYSPEDLEVSYLIANGAAAGSVSGAMAESEEAARTLKGKLDSLLGAKGDVLRGKSEHVEII